MLSCNFSENLLKSLLTEHLRIAAFVFIKDFDNSQKRYSLLLEQILHDENKMISRKKASELQSFLFFFTYGFFVSSCKILLPKKHIKTVVLKNI